MRPTPRMLVVILVVAVAEVAWALLCAETGANLLLFYVGLILASVVFFIPGLGGKSLPSVLPREKTSETHR